MSKNKRRETASSSEAQIAEFYAAVLTQLPALSADQRQYWIRRKKKRLAKVLAVLKDVPVIFEVMVNYGQTLNKMIKECKLEAVGGNITVEHFPIKAKGHKKIELEFFQFDETVRGDHALRRLDEAGYRPVTLPELLALGRDYPEEQCKYPIVALGSFWRDRDGILLVPYLYKHAGKRGLDLDQLGSNFSPVYRFPVVSKAA